LESLIDDRKPKKVFNHGVSNQTNENYKTKKKCSDVLLIVARQKDPSSSIKTLICVEALAAQWLG
jgi:hypothetical protein